MNVSKKQRAAIAAIIIAGLILSGGALFGARGPGSESAKEHAEEKHDAHDTEHGKEEDGHQHDKEGHGGEQEKVALTEAQIGVAGIKVAAAGPVRISTTLELPGEIRFNEDRTAHVVPRLAGVAESVPANLGQQVRKGDLLAVITSTELSEERSALLAAQKRLQLAQTTYAREKKLWEDKISAEQDYLQARQALEEAQIAVANLNQKLQAVGAKPSTTGLNRFEIRAPFDGTVVEKHLSVGESVAQDVKIFTISNLKTVWAEMAVTPANLSAVRVGAAVNVKATGLDSESRGTISYVGSFLGEQSRTAPARVTLPNPNAVWRPGMFVSVEVTTGETEVPVAVEADAIQSVEDKPTIFVATPDGFIVQHVTPGHSDGRFTEIREGLKPGTKYAAKGSFVLKAELGKSEAEHEH